MVVVVVVVVEVVVVVVVDVVVGVVVFTGAVKLTKSKQSIQFSFLRIVCCFSFYHDLIVPLLLVCLFLSLVLK